MKKEKKFVVTDKMQKVAVDILLEFVFLLFDTKDIVETDKILKIIEEMEDKYYLCRDPFTTLLCTSKEYEKSSQEYYRQSMIEKYGYYED